MKNEKSIYTISKEMGYDQYGFELEKEFSFPTSEIEFVHDDILVRRVRKDASFKNIIYSSRDTVEIKNWRINQCLYVSSIKALILFIEKEYSFETILVDFTGQRPLIKFLPIKADRGYILNDWVYFSFFHEQYAYSPWPHDIFRVKVNDWHNPEMVFECSEYDEWFLYPKRHLIATDISLEYLNQDITQSSEIIYNLDSDSYAVVPSMDKNYIEVNGDFFTYFEIEDRSRGIRTIGLEKVINPPNEFPYSRHEYLPREVWYNVPLTAKTFPGTFITPVLLRDADMNELDRLDKYQLRLLRNAIYAQYGYVFQSSDLSDFFNQFEWYRMMTVGRKDNEDIVLLSEDKERVDLILMIEEEK